MYEGPRTVIGTRKGRRCSVTGSYCKGKLSHFFRSLVRAVGVFRILIVLKEVFAYLGLGLLREEAGPGEGGARLG